MTLEEFMPVVSKAGITMEELMAYADGALPPDRRLAVRAALVENPELMELLESFLITRGGVPRTFEGLLAAPVPKRVLDVVHSAPVGRPPVRGSRLRDLVRRPMLGRVGMPVLAAGLGALVAGAWLLGSAPASIGVIDQRGLAPAAAVQQALEGTRSGDSVRIARDLSIRPKLTFRSKAGTWCRQYDLLWDQGLEAANLACRGSDGVWRVLIGTGAVPSRKAVPAGPDELEPARLIEDARRGLIDGTSLRLAEEEQRIRERWATRSP